VSASKREHDMKRNNKLKEEVCPQKDVTTQPQDSTDSRNLIDELQARQIELQKQNEKLEQARAEAEEAYRQYTDLYDFAPVGYFTLTRDGTIRKANLTGRDLLGVDHTKPIPQQLGAFVSETSLPGFKTLFEKLISGTGREICELKLQKENGAELWVRIEATCFEDGEECRAVMMDINELKRMEHEMLIVVTKYKTLFESFPLGVTIADENGNIVETNEIAVKLLDVPREEHVQRNIDGVEWKIIRSDGTSMPPEEFASVRALKENMLIENVEMGIVTPKKTTWISVTAAPLPLEDYGVVVTYGDVSIRKQAEKELFESKIKEQKNAALLRSIMESPKGIVIFALDTNFCYTAFTIMHKNIMKTLWGVDIEPGMSILDVISNPPDREKARENFERVLRGEQFILIEEYGDTTKQRTWYEDRYNPIIDEAGAITGLTVFVTDITERKHAEKVALENQELLALFMKHSPIYTFIKEVSPTESRVLQASNNFQEMIGISGTEMIGKTMQELFPPELAEKFTADDWNVIASGQVLKVDEDLNDRHYTSIKFPLTVGNKTLLAGYTIDITERKQAEKALQESEQRFRSMIQEVQNIAVQGYGMDGTTQYWNTASEKLYGYSAEEALGKSLLELIIPPEMRSDVWQAIQQMAKTGQPIPSAELSLMRKDGSHVTVYSSHAVVSIPGLPAELFCLDVDLTERKRIAALMNARVHISEYADSHSLDELLQKALDEAEVLTGSQIGFAHFLKEDQKTLHLQMWSTNTLAHMCTAEGKGSHYPVEQAGVWAECISTREPVIHNNYAELPSSRRKGLPDGHAPIVRELVVPILRNDLVVMILGVGNKPFEYDDNDINALTQLASSTWDIIQRKQAEEALKTSERKYRLLHESMIDGFVSADMEGNFLDCNEIYRNMLGYSEAELAQLTYKDITPEKWHSIEIDIVENQIIKRGYSDIYEKEYIRKDGTVFPVELHTVLLRDENGMPAGMWAITRDITERKYAERMIESANIELQTALLREQQLARTDPLTGVHNRRHLYEVAEHELQVASRYEQTLSVMMYDIDHFKKVNDTFGHKAGDQILKLVTNTACAELRSADVIGRYGGEEFIIILPMTNTQQAFQLAERIRVNVAALNLATPKGVAAVTLSIGIVEFRHATLEETIENIFRRADEAMYAAKQAGRNRSEIR